MSLASARRVLLLEGPPTGFFSVLERHLEAADVPVTRVLLHAGDWLFARGRGISFRGRVDAFEPFLRELIAANDITDLIYFADRLPYHRVAARVASEVGVIPYAIENGYLRPDWLTFEPGGMGVYSRFPTDRDHIERIAADAPAIDNEIRYRHLFTNEAFHDVAYNFSRLIGSPVYRHFDDDKPTSPVREYAAWIPQLVRRQIARNRAPRQLERILKHNKPYFLIPLQLEVDYQIRDNSPYRRLSEFIDEVFASFAAYAPKETSVLVKIHPLDSGLENWRHTLKRIKRDHDLTGRIRMIAAGSLQDMLDNAAGVVLVNSTVGLYALRAGAPTKALGGAVYNLPDLTDQQPLDTFWSNPRKPDDTYVATFVKALARATQLKGSFYNRPGMDVGAAEVVRRIKAEIGTSDMFVSPPPRLEAARAMGVNVR
ncbi:capsule biosynthesis protein [Acuticoccus sp. I52.16.1]|uniref:capsule biosynthesis protein n=1 Tax=Acuticoccus sp. I52.16.1 TaxID=2928472 RepID=UPI001FD129B8|nr:capsular biosynthesis protein [Acuticoccus sp. I52.16.1]UOM34627.1 capsular biosynthesis protein [Acuticoccus sp. I52.16.1]